MAFAAGPSALGLPFRGAVDRSGARRFGGEDMTRILLVNDTSLSDAHFGCQFVGQAIREQLARTGLQLSATLPKGSSLEDVRSLRHLFDFVIVNGEGTIHHGKGRQLVEVAAEFPSVLINCVYQDNPTYSALADFELVTARESYSAEAIRAEGVACEVVPDVSFASSLLSAYANRFRFMGGKGVRRPLGETDNVVRPWYVSIGGVRVPRLSAPLRSAAKTPTAYLDRLTKYERLCIGRFHGACVAAKLGIPFATWDSNTWKTRALMADMGVPHLHFGSRDEAMNAAREASFTSSIQAYVDAAPSRIVALFDRIAEIARPFEAAYE
jgi:hypothetical protein